MKRPFIIIVLLIVFIMGCAHSTNRAAEPDHSPAEAVALTPQPAPTAADAEQTPAASAAKPVDAMDEEYVADEDEDAAAKEERVTIADPIEPFNRAMYHFNDKMYFWLLKPVSQGYKAVVPEPARVGLKNFFSNLRYPGRFLSCLLQADFAGAASETGRFIINTLWGIGGFLDPSGGKKIDLQPQDTDMGQTLGVYGVGHGFYIVWPFFGPSSPRDTLSVLGDQFFYPPTYLSSSSASFGVSAWEIVNATSLRIGDYESLKGAAVDPYVSMRDAYAQYRMKAVKKRQARSMLFKGEAAKNSPPAQ